MEKVKLTREQANAIRVAVADYGSDNVMNDHSSSNWGNALEPLNVLTPHQLARALYIGYEVELEIKVGDWVADEYLGIIQVQKIESDGVWIGESPDIHEWRRIRSDGINSINNIRDATPKEIAKEKQRRWWNKRNRDVWELKDGDILRCVTTNGLYDVVLINGSVITLQDKNTAFEIGIPSIKNGEYYVSCFSEDRKDVDHD